MPFSVRAYHADHPLTVTKGTAKEAFAKAVEWHVVERFNNVSISDNVKTFDRGVCIVRLSMVDHE